MGALSITADLASKHLSPVLRAKKKLKTLLLEGNELEAKGGIAVLHALGMNEGIEVLSFASNSINAQIVPNLEPFLKERKNLKKLDLNGNRIPKSDIAYIRRTREEVGYGEADDGTWSDNDEGD